MIRIWQ